VVETGAAWSQGEADGGDPIDDQPAPNGWIGARWSGERAYGFARLEGFLDKDDPGPTEVERPGCALADVGGGWRFAEWLELRLAVRNAFDRDYTGSPDESADRSPGRTLTVGFSGRF
jgi:outer membrane receptor protein involved in Fe transport